MLTPKNGFALAALLTAIPAFAQIDLSGSWASRNHEEALERGPGPRAVDYTGLPFNETGRARALSYSQSQLSMPERICAFYSPFQLMMGPFGIKIWNETERLSSKTIAWVIGGWEDRAPTTIWMDARPHPSKNAPHPKSGFTTGTWDGDTLVAYTTHMQAGQIRRNGAPHSDQATMTTHYLRHGDLLTVTALLDDPINLSEPFFLSRTFQMTQAPVNSSGPPCIQGDEGQEAGSVPHYLPGKNPFMDEMAAIYHIPVEAALGGSETMYPDFRTKIRTQFTIPPKCARNCGGGPGGPPGN